MIGSIIQAVMNHFKDTSNETSKRALDMVNQEYKKDAEKPYKEQKQEPTQNQEEQTEEQTEEQSQEEVQEQGKNENETLKQENSNLQGFTISDGNLKNVQNSSDSGTFDNVFSIVSAIRKDLQNVGKSMKGEPSGEAAGENTAKSIYKVVQTKKPKREEPKPEQTQSVPSDECLKQFFYEDDNNKFFDSDILEAYKNLDSVQFTYTEEATELDPSQDTKTLHTGLLAQDIKAQPLLESAVKQDPESGYYMVDTREMTMANAAAISDIAKILDELKAKIDSMTGGS